MVSASVHARRVPALTVPLLAALLLIAAGCGGDNDAGGDGGDGSADQARACSPESPSSDAWTGLAQVEGGVDPDTGAAPVEPFNDFLQDADAPVSTSPCDAAHVFLQLDRPPEEGVTVDVSVEPEDAADAAVVVTLDNLPDDSIAASQWELDFDEQEDGTIRLASATKGQRCQPGRGQQDFSPELCL